MKTLKTGLLLITLILLSNCIVFETPLPSDESEMFTTRKKEVSSLLGSTSEEVKDLFGSPGWIAREGKEKYYIYQWRSTAIFMGWINFIPFTVDAAQGEELHCILLEFGEEDALKSYKIDSATYRKNCPEVFSMLDSSKPILTSAYYYADGYEEDITRTIRHSEDPYSAWSMYLSHEDKAANIDLLCKAADGGIINAQSELGWMYRNGNGVPRDITRAYMWYKHASTQLGGDQLQHARDQLKHIEESMSADEIAQAKYLYSNWSPGQCEDYLLDNVKIEIE